MDVEAKVKEIIVQQLGVDAEKVTPEASFVDDLGADSLDVVELVMAFEGEFKVEIPDEAAEKMMAQVPGPAVGVLSMTDEETGEPVADARIELQMALRHARRFID